MFNRSVRTNVAGLAAIVTAWATQIEAAFDTDPTTLPNWGLAVTVSIAAIGLLLARDNNKRSEQVGASG